MNGTSTHTSQSIVPVTPKINRLVRSSSSVSSFLGLYRSWMPSIYFMIFRVESPHLDYSACERNSYGIPFSRSHLC